MNSFVKSHGLGNDYIVLDSEDINFELTKACVQRICNIHYGIGSDGILLKVKSSSADFGLKIFNPDGSEAEKSGNGLRIFSKYLYDYGFSTEKLFTIQTLGGIVQSNIIELTNNRASKIKVDMGKAIFNSKDIPVDCKGDSCFDQLLQVGDRQYLINCVSVGNPHCVIIKDELNVDEIKHYGPIIENADIFPNKINVQFAKLISDKKVEVIIWERGAGFTLASGSSSCAVAAVMRKKGLVGNEITIRMPGGELEIEIDNGWNIRMTGEVREIANGTLSNELIGNQLKL
jgi:diaminopimelate epimerase